MTRHKLTRTELNSTDALIRSPCSLPQLCTTGWTQPQYALSVRMLKQAGDIAGITRSPWKIQRQAITEISHGQRLSPAEHSNHTYPRIIRSMRFLWLKKSEKLPRVLRGKCWNSQTSYVAKKRPPPPASWGQKTAVRWFLAGGNSTEVVISFYWHWNCKTPATIS